MKDRVYVKRRLRSFLAQGAAGNAIVVYVALIAGVLYEPIPYKILFTVFLPIYFIFAGFVGALVGGVVWIIERLLKRRLGILRRAPIGPLLVFVISAMISSSSWIGRVPWELLLTSLFFGLPASVMAGSRFNPMRAVIFGTRRAVSDRTFVGGFSFPPALTLRLLSLLGLLEAILCLACLAPWSSTQAATRVDSEFFMATAFSILYFVVTVLVSFTSPRTPFVVASALVANAPLVIWAVDPNRYESFGSRFLAVVIWVFVFLWILLVAGRMISPEPSPLTRSQRKRLLPVTMLEIQIRHALNRL